MKKYGMIFLCAIILAASAAAQARDWSDLDEGEHEIFGSEKERKFPINAFFVEKERWENHQSFHFLWFLKTTEYPRYSMFRLLPFYYHLESRIDRREKKFTWLVVPYYRERDLNHEFKTYFPFYTEKTRTGEKDWNILYLFYGGRKLSEEKKESYFGILPLMYYRTLESTRNDASGMLLISPLLMRIHKESGGASPVYEELNISPLHFYNRSRKGDVRTRTWGVPLVPLVYYHSSNAVRHFNLGWLFFDAEWERETGMVHRSFLTPLWYYERDFRSDAHYQTFFMTPFNYYRHFAGPRDESLGDTASVERYQWWFPIVPLLYYRFTSTDTGSHTNFIGIFDWTRDTDRNLTRLWVTPFSFYRRDSYYHFLAPVVLMSWRESTDSRFAGIWGYHHVRRSETNPAEVSMRRWWAPIIPIFYYYGSPAEEHVNLGILFFLFDLKWQHDRLARSFLTPLWYFQRDHYSETSYETTTASLFHFYRHYQGPGEGYAGSNTTPVDRTTTASLFHFYKHYHGPQEGNAGGNAPIVDRTQWWTPIIPLFYHSNYSDEGTHTNVWIFDWAHNPDGSYRRFWMTPLVYHKRDSYFHILPPLYMSWFTSTETFTASLFGYSYSSTDNNTSTWWTPIIPLLYHSYSPQTGSYTNLAWLFGWGFKPDGSFNSLRFWPLAYLKAGEGGSRYLLPLYVRPGGWTEQEGYSFGLPILPYYCRWEDGQTRVRHWMPLYWSWNDLTLFGKEHTTGSIALPLWISYKDDTFELRIYLYGGSKSVSMGPFAPSVMLGLGNRENTWYMDTEWSWLYNAFSISTRTPIRNPFRDRAADAPVPRAALAKADTGDDHRGEAGQPHLNRRSEISRDTSLTFFGWKVLFGWLCYEQADTQRHFRVFPLYWYSWDETSDNKIFNLLIYFYSKSGDQLYHVLFPIYGLSRDGNSYFNAYLLNFYWSEYDAETRLREVTGLWPFFNKYWTVGSAPDGSAQSGWRLFPLIWHKYNRYSNGYERSRTMSPVYYGYETSMPNNESHQRMTISPFHYHWSENRNGSGYSTSSSTSFFPLIPIYYDSEDSTTTAAQGTRPAETRRSWTNFTLPLYYYNRESETRWNRRESTFVIPLLLTYYTSSSYTMTDNAGSPGELSNSMLFFPGFYRNREGSETHYNILLALDMNFNDRDDSGNHMLLPFWYYSWDRPSPGSNRSTERSFMFPILPVAFMYDGNSERGYWSIPFLLTYHGWERNESTWVFAGLWWVNRDSQRSERYTHLLPLWMSWSHTSYKNQNETDRTVLVPFIPLLCLYDGTPSDGYWLSLGTLSYHGWEGNASRWTVLGFFWKYHNQDSTDNYLHILPFWMSWEDTRSNNYHNVIPVLGLYWHNRPGYRHVNWLLMVDYERWESSDTTEIDLLMGIVSTRRTPRMREFEVALGLIASYENQYNSPNWHARLLWLGYERAGNRSTFNFLPLFYRRTIEGGRGYELYRFPLSFWHYESNGRDVFHSLGFGLIYYRNYYPDRNEDRAMVLGGIVWNYVEKPERNYESYGSLWGLLWEYEREERGAYNKFSILKFLFKRVDDHGSVNYRVIGVGF